MTESQREQFDNLGLELKCRLARYAYLLGIDFIDNKEYETLMKQLPATHILQYTRYEDDSTIPIEPYLGEFGLIPQATKDLTMDEMELLRTTSRQFGKNLSIAMVDEHSIVTEKFIPALIEGYRQHNLPTDQSGIMSYKLDGWNITNYYGPEGLVLSHTRMKSDGSKPIICTNAMRKLLPDLKWTSGGLLRIITELNMFKFILEELREYYGEPFKNTRNSITSVVHETIDVERFSHGIVPIAFSAKDTLGNLKFATQLEVFQWLEANGFTVPDYMVFDGTSEEDYMRVFKYMEDVYIREIHPNLECDGLVFQANHSVVRDEITPVRTGDFQNGATAVKADYWARKFYTSTVEKIIYTGTRANNSVMALITPVTEDGGNTLTRVPLNNLNTALPAGVVVGSKINFSYHSRQITQFEGVL